MDEAILARVEEQRLVLEENIAKLRKSLRHWQTLEIDYEGLKEEFLGLSETASVELCLQAARDFNPEVVDDKELQTLISDGRGVPKKPSQLVDLLTKRTDYVTRNVETIRKQLSDAEKKRNALLLAENPEFQDDAGLPLREITEELDEEGNILSSTVEAPGAQSSTLIDILRKAGVTDLPEGKGDAAKASRLDAKADVNTSSESVSSPNKSALATFQAILDSSKEDQNQDRDSSDDDDGNLGEIDIGQDLMQSTNPNDTEEEAALRHEMLEYGLGEVGNIVAELEIEDTDYDVPYDEYDDEDLMDSADDEDEDPYSDDSEDERGMTKRPMISDRYRQRMEALEQKLGVKNLQNLGPSPTLPGGVKRQIPHRPAPRAPSRPSPAEAARKAAIARYNANKSQTLPDADDRSTEAKGVKKRVAFSEELDIAPEPKKAELTPVVEASPIGEAVVERSTMAKPVAAPSPPAFPPTKRVSKFKAARMETPQTPKFPPPTLTFPSQPTELPEQQNTSNIEAEQSSNARDSRILSKQIVERVPDANTVFSPDSNDFDETLHRAEIASEYQKLRNRKIHEQGGYVRGGEQDNYGDEVAAPIVEDELTGKPRKVSRFKAARVQQS